MKIHRILPGNPRIRATVHLEIFLQQRHLSRWIPLHLMWKRKSAESCTKQRQKRPAWSQWTRYGGNRSKEGGKQQSKHERTKWKEHFHINRFGIFSFDIWVLCHCVITILDWCISVTGIIKKFSIKRKQVHFQQRQVLLLFSCPEQLNRWPCHSLTHSLTDSLTVLLLLTYKERP